MNPSPSYRELCWAFIKIGLFTFGGGYAMIPLIEDLCVEKKGWLTPEEMAHTIVIAESTPGPIAINCATFVGFKQRRWLGALATTLGICLPSFLIIYAISLCLSDLLTIAWIAHAFNGIKVAVALLIIQAGLKMARQQLYGSMNVAIISLALLALIASETLVHFSSSLIMAGAVLISIACYALSGATQAEVTKTLSPETNREEGATANEPEPTAIEGRSEPS